MSADEPADPRDDPEVAAILAEASSGPVTIDMTTIGRRTGEPRRIEIWFIVVDGQLYVTGTPGRRDWFANLTADPRVVLHLRTADGEIDLHGDAVIVADPAERRDLFAHPAAQWYVGQSSTADLVAHAPTVRVEPITGRNHGTGASGRS